MKYAEERIDVTSSSPKALVAAGLIFALSFVAACGSQQVKVANTGDTRPDLRPTSEYLPVAKKDKEGKVLEYKTRENPYIKRGRIKKKSVAAFIEARKAFKKKAYDLAEKQLKSLISLDKSLSGPWVMLGDIARDRGSLKAAAGYYRKAVEVNKNNVNAWLRLALIQRKQGKYVLSQNTYASALQTWPDYPEAHLNLAIHYDLYLNLPMRAQKHMEAYLFLSKEKNEKVSAWLEELQGRTGMALSLPVGNDAANPEKIVAK